jgi:hypothetical protein
VTRKKKQPVGRKIGVNGADGGIIRPLTEIETKNIFDSNRVAGRQRGPAGF